MAVPGLRLRTGAIGTDAIAVAVIYRASHVTPIGAPAILDAASFVDPRATGFPRNRPALAQTFSDGASTTFTVAVNHLRAKGCSGASGPDQDQGNGAACFDETRRLAMLELDAWLQTDPTGSGDPDFLVMGDLNAYAMESPITSFLPLGYVDLVAQFRDDAATFVFDGQSGTLDYLLASDSFAAQVDLALEWRINADEVELLDYNDSLQTAGESFFEAKPTGTSLFDGASPARSSDHDPVVAVLPEPGVGPSLAVASLALAAWRKRANARNA